MQISIVMERRPCPERLCKAASTVRKRAWQVVGLLGVVVSQGPGDEVGKSPLESWHGGGLQTNAARWSTAWLEQRDRSLPDLVICAALRDSRR